MLCGSFITFLAVLPILAQSAPQQSLIDHWSGRYAVQDCQRCDGKLGTLKEVEIEWSPGSSWPLCVQRVYQRAQTYRTKMGNCFKREQMSGDPKRLILRKIEPNLFDLEILIRRMGDSNQVDISIRRKANPSIRESPLGEPASIDIGILTERVISSD